MDLKDTCTISVYDTEQKKLVLILRDYTIAAKYLFGETDFKSVWVRNFNRYIKNKRINKTNNFNKKLTFRISSNEQKKQLDINDVLVLDDDFLVNQKMKLLTGQYMKIKLETEQNKKNETDIIQELDNTDKQTEEQVSWNR